MDLISLKEINYQDAMTAVKVNNKDLNEKTDCQMWCDGELISGKGLSSLSSASWLKDANQCSGRTVLQPKTFCSQKLLKQFKRPLKCL